MADFEPGAILLAAGNALLQKKHSFCAIEHVCVDRIFLLDWAARGPQCHVVVRRPVDIRESFKQSFGMATWEPAGSVACFVHVPGTRVAGIKFGGLTVLSELHHVWIFLVPLE